MILHQNLFNAESVAASGTAYSTALDLRDMVRNGMFSLFIKEAGDGTGKWEFELSYNYDPVNETGDWVTPTGSSDIIAAFTKSDGPGSDGIDAYTFEPDVSPFLRIKVTETGGADALECTAVIAMQ